MHLEMPQQLDFLGQGLLVAPIDLPGRQVTERLVEPIVDVLHLGHPHSGLELGSFSREIKFDAISTAPRPQLVDAVERYRSEFAGATTKVGFPVNCPPRRKGWV